MAAQSQSPQDVYTQNSLARQLVVNQSLDMIQSIFNTTVPSPTFPQILNISPRFVGLAKRFYVKVSVLITNTDGAHDLSLTDLAGSNLLSQVVFNDLQNNVRIQTAGWHLAMIAAAKAKFSAGASFNQSNPMFSNVGYNTGIIYAPATIAHGTSATVTYLYEVPLAYTDMDLRGAVYLNTVNATANLQLTVNPAIVAGSAADDTFSVYSNANNASYTITNLSVNVYQNYLDQLPTGNNGVTLPLLDISTIYELKNTSLFGITANQDFPIQYPNYRQFLSTCAIFDNGGTLNNGSDVNYWALQAANFTNIWKMDPYMSVYLSNKELHDNTPKGSYYWSHRHRPIATQQYGNTELVLNASTVNSNAFVALGFEDFALQNVLTSAGSFPGS